MSQGQESHGEVLNSEMPVDALDASDELEFVARLFAGRQEFQQDIC